MTIEQLFSKINEFDRLASELSWKRLRETCETAMNDILIGMENALTQDEYDSLYDEAIVTAYYITQYQTMESLCTLQ